MAGNGPDPDLKRIEERSLNVTHSSRQIIYDGWLLRLLPGKSKRARSVNALFGSTLPLAQKIRHCEAVYGRAGLPTVFRLTPFDQPTALDAALAEAGYRRFDETLVCVAALDEAPLSSAALTEAAGVTISVPALAAFAEAVGVIRDAPASQRRDHERRLRETPVGWRGFVAWRGGAPLAAGQLAYEEAPMAGLYDIVTVETARGQGIGTALCASMLEWAWGHGARQSYLQVTADNAAALAVYRKFGFVEGYRYHYRGRPEDCE
jgi:GNAT superfamily N-acetyltransferase